MTENAESQHDLDLLRLARSGQGEAFESLLERLEPRVFALTMRLLRHRQDAEDVTQQTFVKVIENLEQFREESSVATWVLRISEKNVKVRLLPARLQLRERLTHTLGDEAQRVQAGDH